VLKVLFWLVALLLIAFVVVFAASNPTPVSLNLWPFVELVLPLYAIVLVGALIGFLLGAIVGWGQSIGVRQRVRELMRELERERRESIALRERAAKYEAAEERASIPPPPAAAA
jgi:Uncharacterized integral membrane protein